MKNIPIESQKVTEPIKLNELPTYIDLECSEKKKDNMIIRNRASSQI